MLRFPRPPTISLSFALTIPMLIHRLLFISPLSRHADRLTLSIPTALYYAVAMLLYTGSIIAWISVSTSIGRLLIPTYGNIWLAISLMDTLLAKTSLLVICFQSLYKSGYQIEFFHTLADIDTRLRANCGYSMRYERLFVGYVAVLGAGAVILYWAIGRILEPLDMLSTIGLLPLPVYLIFGPIAIERVTVMLITCVFVACATLIRTRLRVLKHIIQGARRRRPDWRRGRVSFAAALSVYVDLCRLIELLSNYMGVIMLMRFVHDFILMTSSAYFLCGSLMQLGWREIRENWTYASAALMLAYHVARPLLVCVVAELTIDAASDCHRELNRYRTKTMEDQDLMESFHYWSLHSYAHFPAAQVLNVNAAFLYAMLGAMSTYLLVLMQFQMQADELNGDNVSLPAELL